MYKHLIERVAKGKKGLAVLIDPDKMAVGAVEAFVEKVESTIATHIFVGGSTVAPDATAPLILALKAFSKLPIVLFPGDVGQISNAADALLFLSLISGNNPEYLIGQQVKAVPKLRNSKLEIIPTGYILVENGKPTSVEKVTRTKPLPRKEIQTIADTAKAGELLGMHLIYLETGSGATHPVPPEIISFVKQDLNIPLIVGGGIKTKKQLDEAFEAGADLVVIGTAFEEDESFFLKLKKEPGV
ncbi:geranylgeranylglyceryl/heptaprenylglyceryl phosphate synthase [Subsaximicrobium wynnwilliamsii]|uniref:Geranylgeranylglyceryl phosphate synthase n=1 Tax=Subsaximicrobium wynnwilliamsii TaxID=291179 RepID=A0A5C6ZJV4_9FLAO|nr:geranylgeranylglyceryl/heptaprenylglyceryl phosphate synthase [Subsaximicrobium wynnwilliamsii]TXD83698.1 geranylgeranylglyceryl/heptaprenylglyceryl phosphate synthase [Subsaximicrobium wynnwilliamsii]TXD89418.1 geranylgeranylglyceryl/heptaprenylglyceryl phosphate synthase [Subsaximicrobium wynnwilliamsii]TXE03535.1 geranylgeranylglyceryl/heptaprenylglyceryl phosphate synthase [Subsaximicrobium wynnwilliamsii]